MGCSLTFHVGGVIGDGVVGMDVGVWCVVSSRGGLVEKLFNGRSEGERNGRWGGFFNDSVIGMQVEANQLQSKALERADAAQVQDRSSQMQKRQREGG